MMDGSVSRRGQPCWYLRADVGIGHAINDAILIYYCLQQLLRANFENSPHYLAYVHNFNEVCIHEPTVLWSVMYPIKHIIIICCYLTLFPF